MTVRRRTKVTIDPVPTASVRPDRFWVTRDRFEGAMLGVVDVWLVRPEAQTFSDGDVMWQPSADDLDSHLEQWSLVRCLSEIRVVPDAPLECLVIG